jgi:hypothetical protein
MAVKRRSKKRNRPSQWEQVDAAKHANVYLDRLRVIGGHLYLVTKMIDPKKPSAGASVHGMVFVPSTYRVVHKGIVAEKVR